MSAAETDCPFCALPPARIIAENALAVAVRDAFPVSPGHTLLITRRHVESWFDTTDDERLALFALADQLHLDLDVGPSSEARSTTAPAGQRAKEDQRRSEEPQAFNLGLNVGTAAGQTIMHVHLHLIPRFPGDVDDPTGGVRAVIPGQASYRR